LINSILKSGLTPTSREWSQALRAQFITVIGNKLPSSSSSSSSAASVNEEADRVWRIWNDGCMTRDPDTLVMISFIFALRSIPLPHLFDHQIPRTIEQIEKYGLFNIDVRRELMALIKYIIAYTSKTMSGISSSSSVTSMVTPSITTSTSTSTAAMDASVVNMKWLNQLLSVLQYSINDVLSSSSLIKEARTIAMSAVLAIQQQLLLQPMMTTIETNGHTIPTPQHSNNESQQDDKTVAAATTTTTASSTAKNDWYLDGLAALAVRYPSLLSPTPPLNTATVPSSTTLITNTNTNNKSINGVPISGGKLLRQKNDNQQRTTTATTSSSRSNTSSGHLHMPSPHTMHQHKKSRVGHAPVRSSKTKSEHMRQQITSMRVLSSDGLLTATISSLSSSSSTSSSSSSTMQTTIVKSIKPDNTNR
jgi:hypothetical protein